MHSIIDPLSDLWWRGIFTTFLTLLIFIITFRKSSQNLQNRTIEVLRYSAIVVYLLTTVFAIQAGELNIQDFLSLQ